MATNDPQLRHDSVFSTSDSLMTSDDTAALLSHYCQSSSSAAAGHSIYSCQAGSFPYEGKSTVVDQKHNVYTITDDSLPSHMRSLLPSHEQHVHDLLTLERTRRRLRHVIIGLTLVLTLAVLVAVILVFSLKVRVDDMGLLQKGSERIEISEEEAQITEVDTEVKVALLDSRSLGGPSRLDWPVYTHSEADEQQRTPCLRECWAYAAFRFRSECYYGYCECHNDNYNSLTCLPQYKSCSIKRQTSHLGLARYQDTNQTTYMCRTPPTDNGNVHVISLFGNHRSPSTHVTVTRPSAKISTLVLVSYHSVKWTVHLPKTSAISNIFVLSMKTDWEPDHVVIQWLPLEGQGQATADSLLVHEKVKVQYRVSMTGYGEDKNGGHTPQLLQYIDDAIGPVASFLGAAHADAINLDLDSVEMSGSTTSANANKTSSVPVTV